MNFKSLESADDAPDNPYELFSSWFEEAEKTEPVDPNAMMLATVDDTGMPQVRAVLLKGQDDRGFVFYTNRQSRKGQALQAHPKAALCFYWKSLGRQIRIEGMVENVSDQEADAYFASRHRGSRLGAWASQQSRPLENRQALKDAVAALEERFDGKEDIDRPPYWSGYRVIPQRMEFWHDGEYRLHTRMMYTKDDSGNWSREMLYP